MLKYLIDSDSIRPVTSPGGRIDAWMRGDPGISADEALMSAVALRAGCTVVADGTGIEMSGPSGHG